MKVDFIGIGISRSGTTWLFYTLGQHPDICLSEPKEVLYFNKFTYSDKIQRNPDNSNINFNKSIKWYLRHFDHCSSESIKGEFSPAYFLDPFAPQRIKSQFPDVKLILNLRNPVDWIYALYWQRRGYARNEKRSFEDLIKNDHEFVAKGLHSRNFKMYLEEFDRDQIKINLFDDIVDSPEKLLSENLNFLGLDSSFKFNLEKSPKNSAKNIRFGYAINIMGKFTSTMINLKQNKILKYVRSAGLKELIFKIISSSNNYPDMDMENREYLKQIYSDDISRLENLSGIDLKKWK